MAQLQAVQDYTVKGFDPMESMGGALKMRGQQLSQDIAQSQEQRAAELAPTQLQAQQAELARFNEESNIRSMVDASQQYLTLPTPESKEIYLQDRVRDIAARGGDPRDTAELLSMTPEQREETALNVVELGKQRGLLKEDPKTVARKNLIVKKVKVGDEWHQIGFDPITGEQVADLGLAPEAEKRFETQTRKEVAKGFGLERKDIKGRRVQAEKQLGLYTRLSHIIKNESGNQPMTRGSILAGPLLGIRKAVNAVLPEGAQLGGDTSKEEIMDAANNSLALLERVAGTGAMSDKEFDFYKSAVPGLGDSVSAFKIKLALANATQKYNLRMDSQRIKMMEKFPHSPTAVDEGMEEWKVKNPLFDKLTAILESFDKPVMVEATKPSSRRTRREQKESRFTIREIK